MSAAYSMEARPREPFSAALERAQAREGHLCWSDVMAATHAELEVYMEWEGREYERRLPQAHLDLRAARERVVERSSFTLSTAPGAATDAQPGAPGHGLRLGPGLSARPPGSRRHRGRLPLRRPRPQGPHRRPWVLAGAEALLRLRALWTNGDFDDTSTPTGKRQSPDLGGVPLAAWTPDLLTWAGGPIPI